MTKEELIKAIQEKIPLFWQTPLGITQAVLEPIKVARKGQFTAIYNWKPEPPPPTREEGWEWLDKHKEFSIATPEQLKLCGVPERKEV